ncbi:MAG TPA: bifunctional DNA-binding transcriptional regulator/O6-methylguanine-DNA methyltransferase Ada [Bryobacteraceae bacterium]|nr:bifunctional DNA-binding transcriptional regulator/O6-methylguanine-DNA methyltransferase Ada [Bryobacteraceae bacterium]
METSSQLVMDEARWQLVLARELCTNERFVYAVRSTGVYCRPGCPSRRPRRSNVIFFPVPDAAERAGYRPCLRCRPQQPDRSRHAELIRRACRTIEEHLDEPLALADLARKLELSPFHLDRTFKRFLGITPKQYTDALRLERLKANLRDGREVTESLYDAGYGSSRSLYERAPEQLGMTPATYRNGGRGMNIGYTIVASPLGRLLVAGTERGICAVSLGDSDDTLTRSLDAEYPEAEIRRDQTRLRPWISALVAHLCGKQPQLDLPLDVQATAFQWRVWQELRKIPYGETRSYSEIAKAIGRPTAARAVANACATNPAALVIPCHRIVQESGEPGGYRWGDERKRALLSRENLARV